MVSIRFQHQKNNKNELIMKIHPAAVVEVTRGGFVESSHEIDIVVADAEGKLVEVWGDQDRSIFPRSSIKALQALPLIESGAADAYGFEAKHFALACSSHNGQAIHKELAEDMLSRVGVNDTCLECGATLPGLHKDKVELAKSGGAAAAIYNPCSGKHAGFIAFAKHVGLPVDGYVKLENRVQKEIAGVLEDTIGTPHNNDNYGIDGCSIPTFKTPIDRLAIACAKFGVGNDPSSERSSAMITLRDACLKHPEMVAGEKRACTMLMRAMGNRAFVKFGAEGVFTASLPELGLGITMKARDGSQRAIEVAIASIIERYLELDEAEEKLMSTIIRPPLKNANGIEVGRLRFSG